jgi:hypothetical protein
MHDYQFEKDGYTFKFDVCGQGEFTRIEAWKDGVNMLDRRNNPDYGSRWDLANTIYQWWDKACKDSETQARLDSMGLGWN